MLIRDLDIRRSHFRSANVRTREGGGTTKGYDVIVATRRTHPELVERLQRLSGWRLLYADSNGAAFVRS